MNEKYIPLYRKYRPQTLEEIVGQEHIKKALSNAIKLNKISHAYLFTGPRGTGKTSTARILAKSLNCEKGPTVSPCGRCPSCIDITNSTPIDVIEIDAASNRSVNDAQNILEKIHYAPVNGKYKIYIIDEVHMLSTEAFNALLKTLEEPPENVVFILATTEVQKVLDTIKSRCQRFDFKRITTDDIVKHLRKISDLEHINIEDEALLSIAQNSAGGMRDSLALLDQLSVLDTQNAISTNDINMLLGRISFDVLNKLSNNIIKSNPNDAIIELEKIYNSGNEPAQILTNLLNYLKNMLIVKNCKGDLLTDLTQLTQVQIDILKKQAENLETQQIIFLIERTTYYIQTLRTTSNRHIWLEIAMIDLSNLAENSKLSELQERISALEQGNTPVHSAPPAYKKPSTIVTNIYAPSEKKDIKENIKTEIENTHKSETEQQVVIKEEEEKETLIQKQETEEILTDNHTNDAYAKADLTTMWHELLNNIKSPGTKALLQQMAKPVEITPENVVITLRNEKFVNQWNEPYKKQNVIDAANKLFNQKTSNVIFRLPKSTDKELVEKNTAQTEQSEIKQTENTKKIIKDVEIKTDNPDMTEVVQVETEEIQSEQDIKNSYLSDKARMVKDLFDGKVIE